MEPILSQSLAQHAYLREQLLVEYREIDEDALQERLEAISTLPEALAAAVRSYLDDLALAAALGSRIDDMKERLERIEIRAEKKRATVTAVMGRAELKKLVEPDFTVSLRAIPRQLVIEDESQIPEAYWVPQPPRLDRRRLTAVLTGEVSVPGAMLGNGGMTIAVRTK